MEAKHHVQAAPWYPYPKRTKAMILSGLADAQHRHTISGYMTMLAQHLRRVLLAIILGYHSQRGGTTVHLVELQIMRKTFEHN